MSVAAPLPVFLLASLALAATPGPGVAYIVTRTLAQGRRAGLASVAGVALGNLGNALGASLGLAVLFTLWPDAFTLVRLGGAAYLVWLGVGALRTPDAVPDQATPRTPRVSRLLRDGFVVALLNPKTALFFAAFLPQFVDPAAPALRQSVGLGAIFVVIAAMTDLLYVLAAGALAPWFARRPGLPAFGRRASAAVYFALGLWAALTGSRATA